ncbi:fimbrial protein [Burkholderia sp. AU30198]|uniref:fimbrial protein n=1 Tax=Burkholderia sp. AU30198 TaxID=2879627 RepID=UPI001CF36CD3|nr:fimbrial protein [Burkholderia sp. AU30198]MCA8293764.1 fimbrial protein [Burkholderia sp. AU30198]
MKIFFRVLKCLPLLALVACSMEASAASCGWVNPNYSSPYQAKVALSGKFNVPRDAPIGTVIAKFSFNTGFDANERILSQCSSSFPASFLPVSTPHGAATDKVFPTGVQGVGVKLSIYSEAVFAPSSWTLSSYNIQWGSPAYVVTYAFVKTGPISAGTVSSVDVPTAQQVLDGNTFVRIAATGSVEFGSAACQTSDVAVDLGTRNRGDKFTGIGYTTPPVGFDLAFRNCPAEVARIGYQLVSPAGSIDAKNGVFKLSSNSSAKGIGIRVTRADGTPVALETMNTFDTKGAADHTIALRASYYQSAAKITPGSADGQLAVTVNYN